MKKFFAILRARTIEFYRDRGTMIWTFVFPVLAVGGLGFAFSGKSQDQYKVAVIGNPQTIQTEVAPFFHLNYVNYVSVSDVEKSIDQVRRHQFDLLVDPQLKGSSEGRYWVNDTSPKGYFMEKLLPQGYAKQTVSGAELRYVDWLLPGLISMNMMFSALFGVGYTIVRYRKNGVLKRLKATPVTAFQFLSAQVVSRLLIIQAVASTVFLGCKVLMGVPMRGSYLDLFLFMSLGAMALISLSTLIAARIQSEEFAEGMLNLMTWPMMFFSGVWFSLEGTNPVLQKAAQVLPLTHIVNGARAIMLDGTPLFQLGTPVGLLAALTLVFLGVGSALFRWN